MNLPEKPKRMIHYLEEKIVSGYFAANSRLPSIRELMEQFSLTYGTVKRGIDYLHQKGLVEIRPKSGVYVQNKNISACGTHRISLLFSNSNYCMARGIYSTIFLGIQKAAESANCSLMMDYLPINDATQEKLIEKTSGADGIILMAEYDRAISDLNFTVPGVGVCMNSSMNGSLSILDIDPFDIASKATDFYKKQGIKHVIVIDDDNASPAYVNRGQLFTKNWLAADPSHTADSKTYKEPLPDSNSIGLLFTTGSVAQYCFANNRETHRELFNKSSSLLSIDGKNLLDPDYNQVNTISLDWQSVGRYALEECVYRINNPGSIPKRIYLPGILTYLPETKRGSVNQS